MANLNCPGQIVISGETDKIGKACEMAKAKGAKRAVLLPVAGAYHSRLMVGAQEKVRDMLAKTPVEPAQFAVISNVTAKPHGGPDEIRQRLVEQVVSPVRWEDSIRYLLENGFRRFIELGPGDGVERFFETYRQKRRDRLMWATFRALKRRFRRWPGTFKNWRRNASIGKTGCGGHRRGPRDWPRHRA